MRSAVCTSGGFGCFPTPTTRTAATLLRYHLVRDARAIVAWNKKRRFVAGDIFIPSLC